MKPVRIAVIIMILLAMAAVAMALVRSDARPGRAAGTDDACAALDETHELDIPSPAAEALPAEDGLDASFAGGGIYYAGEQPARYLAIGDDGSVVTGGATPTGIELTALTTDGDVEDTFGNGGQVVVPLVDGDGDFDDAYVDAPDMAVSRDGDFYIAAIAKGDVKVVAISASGECVSSFGDGGVATMDLNSDELRLQAITVDNRNRVVVLGNDIERSDGVIARLTADGDPDESFGDNGVVRDMTISDAYELAAQSDGALLALTTRGEPTIGRPVIKRFSESGVLDTDYVPALPSASTLPTGIAVQADDKLLLAATFGSTSVVARYKLDGSLDRTFAHNGKVTVPAGHLATRDVLVAIVRAGGGTAVATKHGSLAKGSFGVPPPSSLLSDFVIDVVTVQPDGKTLISGYSEEEPNDRVIRMMPRPPVQP